MSRETTDWLNRFTLQSKAAWHTDEQLQKIYNTIYNGPIPVEDVQRRLFNWEAVEATLTAKATILNDTGVQVIEIADSDRKAILRPPGALFEGDPGAVMGIFKNGYQGHSYKEWLLEQVAMILDDDLGIYSAGLLRGGAQAWVQVTVPETFTTPEGVSFQPNLLAVTSFDGSLATTYKRTVTNTVCDNTMSAALGESSANFKVKHSKYSQVKLMEAREALELVHTIADDFSAQVAELCDMTVTDAQFEQFLEEISPTVDKKTGEYRTGNGATQAAKRHDTMWTLWRNDVRVTPWKNTAYGVIQAENTYAHHLQTVRGAERDERNMSLAVTGAFDKLDADTLNKVMAICNN